MTVYDTNRKRNLFADISAEELAELRHYKCEAKGNNCVNHGTQRHHGLIRRSKRFVKQLDVLINYQLVCYVCHVETGYADSEENHINFYQRQCDRYGKQLVDDWVDSLGFKIAPDVQKG